MNEATLLPRVEVVDVNSSATQIACSIDAAIAADNKIRRMDRLMLSNEGVCSKQ